jgi:hypothetical protein
VLALAELNLCRSSNETSAAALTKPLLQVLRSLLPLARALTAAEAGEALSY